MRWSLILGLFYAGPDIAAAVTPATPVVTLIASVLMRTDILDLSTLHGKVQVVGLILCSSSAAVRIFLLLTLTTTTTIRPLLHPNTAHRWHACPVLLIRDSRVASLGPSRQAMAFFKGPLLFGTPPEGQFAPKNLPAVRGRYDTM